MHLKNWSNLQFSEKTKFYSPPAIIFILSAIIAFAVFPSCGTKVASSEKSWFLMDTLVTIKAYGTTSIKQKLTNAVEAAAIRMGGIDSLTNNYVTTSQITKINLESWKRNCQVNSDMINMLQIAQEIFRTSDGAFDPTIGALTELWGFGRKTEMNPPEPAKIFAARSHVNGSLMQIHGNNITLNDSLMHLDLGGVAKGYAIDCAIEVLRSFGITDALVDAGGDLRAIASSLTSGRRNVYVRHPVKKDSFFCRFPMDSGAVATSGDYERFFILNNIRYHHILDRKTGYPARGCHSVTIVGKNAAQCDALATAVFVLGPEKGMQLIEKLADIEGLIIYEKDHQLTHKVSTGLADKLTFLD